MADTQVAWPPAPHAQHRQRVKQWSAMWSGDLDALATAFPTQDRVQLEQPRNRPSQHRGGVVGVLSRFWWGQPRAVGSTSRRYHLPVAADIAVTSARLLFGEEVALNPVDDPSDSQKARLVYLVEQNRLHQTLLEAAEVGSATSGVYLAVTWDADSADHATVFVAHPDQAVPVFSSGGNLAECTFEQTYGEARASGGTGSTVWRHFQRYVPGGIEHELWKGTANTKGKQERLAAHQATRDYVEFSEDGFTAVVETGYPGLACVYIPNVTPQRGSLRVHPTGRWFGRSDFEGSEQLHDSIDQTFTSLMTDIKLSRAFLAGDESLLEPGQAMNLDREMWVGMTGPDGKVPISLFQPDIRVDKFLTAIEAEMRLAYTAAGYSPSTFGLSDTVGVTATEVTARERKTMATREAKTRLAGPAISDLILALTAIDAAQFVDGGGTPIRVKVEFPAAVSPSLGEVAQSVQILRAAEAISIFTAVRMLHPDWDDTQVQEEVDRIMTESGRAVVDLGVLPA